MYSLKIDQNAIASTNQEDEGYVLAFGVDSSKITMSPREFVDRIGRYLQYIFLVGICMQRISFTYLYILI